MNKIENRLTNKKRKASNSLAKDKAPKDENFITTMTEWNEENGSEKIITMNQQPTEIVSIKRTKTKTIKSKKRYSNSSNVSLGSQKMAIQSKQKDNEKQDFELVDGELQEQP